MDKTIPSTKINQQLLQNVIPWILILLLPILVFSLSASILIQINHPDAYYYTGYIHNYADLLERYGRTYYSTRISFIYPERILVWLFGSKEGYYIFRYLLLTALLASFWKISRVYYSKTVSILIVFIVAFNPWILRSLYHDYLDGTAVVYLIIALHFLIAKYNSKIIPPLLAGVFYAMSVNCNFFALAIGGIFLPSWIILQLPETKQIFKKLCFILSGFLGWYAFLFLITFLEFPEYNPFFEITTLSMSKIILQAGVNSYNGYWRSLTEMLYNNIYAYNPIITIFPLFAFLISFISYQTHRKGKRKNTFSNDKLGYPILLYLFLTIFLYLLLHFAFKQAVLAGFYISYSIPATLLMIMWLLGTSSSSLNQKQQVSFSVLAGTIYTLCLWISHLNFVQNINTPALMSIYLTFSLLLGLTVWILQKKSVLQTLTIFVAISLSPFFSSYVLYDLFSLSKHRSTLEWDVYKGSVQLQKWITTLPPSFGITKFWYKDDIDGIFRSVQSTMLWGPINRFAHHNMNMPILDHHSLNDLSQVDYLAILGNPYEQVLEGQKTLNSALANNSSVKMTEIMKGKYYSDTFNYNLLLLKKENKVGKFISNILSAIDPENNSLLIQNDNHTLLKTGSKQWIHSTVIPLKKHVNEEEITIKIKLKVNKGKLGIAILDQDSNQLIFTKIITPSSEPFLFDMGTYKLKGTNYYLVTCNAAEFENTEAELYEINIFKPSAAT